MMKLELYTILSAAAAAVSNAQFNNPKRLRSAAKYEWGRQKHIPQIHARSLESSMSFSMPEIEDIVFDFDYTSMSMMSVSIADAMSVAQEEAIESPMKSSGLTAVETEIQSKGPQETEFTEMKLE